MPPTPYESADLILRLFELRREPKLREARDWWTKFNPKSSAEIMAVIKGPDAGKFAMPLGYWEMAAALVNHGAIDAKMFADTNFEHVFLFAKLQPYLAEGRKMDPDMLAQLEKCVMGMPDAQKRLDHARKMMEMM